MSALWTRFTGGTSLSTTDPFPHALRGVRALQHRTSAAAAAGGRRGLRLPRGSWMRLLSPLVVLVIWQLVSALSIVSAQKLPPPTKVWSTALSLITANSPAYGTLQHAMLVSLERFVAGFALGGTAAPLLAITAGLSQVGELTIDPLVQMIRTLPLFGLIPVFIVWFGIGSCRKYC